MSYLVRKDVVSTCLERLRQRRTHEHFAGYLCLQYRAAAAQTTEHLQPNFVEFFDKFYRVDGGPAASPYIKPFIKTAPSISNAWMNRNVAGSYAPSSIRETFKKVVSVQNGDYSLHRNHARLALDHLLLSRRLNVFDLAIFLYRDFPLMGDDPKIEDIVSIFAVEFGYESATGVRNVDFDTLYDLERPEALNDDLLEAV